MKFTANLFRLLYYLPLIINIFSSPFKFLSTYKDSSFDASSTVTFKNIGGYNETFYVSN